ncbi:MAG: SUMF1/EgtB/PvdO family nonheme iron enzyme [Bacteroidota bacterium]
MNKWNVSVMMVINRYLAQWMIVLAVCIVLTSRAEEPRNRPFGMVKINDTLYMDETEVSIGMWLAFYNWTLKQESVEAANALLPDSSAIEPAIWTFIQRSCMEFEIALRIKQSKTELDIVKVSDLKTYLGYYQTSKLSKEESALLDVAITGVSYKQVMKFCKWRSTLFTTTNHSYRLTTLQEWKTIATYVLTANKSDTLFKGKYPLFNYNNQLVEKWPAFKTAIQPNGMFPGNNLGLDNFFGNVSEMVMDEGKAVGGNYNLYAWQCQPDNVQIYTKPQLWLGFRCIYTISQ